MLNRSLHCFSRSINGNKYLFGGIFNPSTVSNSLDRKEAFIILKRGLHRCSSAKIRNPKCLHFPTDNCIQENKKCAVCSYKFAYIFLQKLLRTLYRFVYLRKDFKLSRTSMFLYFINFVIRSG